MPNDNLINEATAAWLLFEDDFKRLGIQPGAFTAFMEGYKSATASLEREIATLRDRLGEITADRDNYRNAYNEVSNAMMKEHIPFD